MTATPNESRSERPFRDELRRALVDALQRLEHQPVSFEDHLDRFVDTTLVECLPKLECPICGVPEINHGATCALDPTHEYTGLDGLDVLDISNASPVWAAYEVRAPAALTNDTIARALDAWVPVDRISREEAERRYKLDWLDSE